MKKVLNIVFLIILFLLIVNIPKIEASSNLIFEGELAPNSKSACLVEASTNTVLYAKSENEKMAPASMTKVMSMLLVMEALDSGKIKLDDMVVATEEACRLGGSQIYLEVNEKMSVEDLIKSMAIASANDATMALALYIAGNEDSFVSMMNERARSLGMNNTNYVNPYGFDNPNHYTSSRDMATLSCYLINNHPKILEYTSRYEDYVREDSQKKFWLVNTNKLVKFIDGVDGLKTGWTNEAGYCLTSTIKKDNKRYLAVSMNCESPELRNKDIVSMLTFAVNNYDIITYKTRGEIVEEINDYKFSPSVYHLMVEEDINIVVKKSVNGNNITSVIENGKIKVFVDDELYKEYDLSVDEEVKKKSFFEMIIMILKEIIFH